MKGEESWVPLKGQNRTFSDNFCEATQRELMLKSIRKGEG